MIHPTADVSADAKIGAGTRVWHYAQIREGAVVGEECIIGKGVYIDRDVVVGNRVKIQNQACLYRGLRVDDGVFIGPHVVFANDRYPRAISKEGRLLGGDDWRPESTHVGHGASIGAGSVVLPGVSIGRWAMVAAGSLVSRDVPDQALVMGRPARQRGYVCECGHRLEHGEESVWRCLTCGATYSLPLYRTETP